MNITEAIQRAFDLESYHGYPVKLRRPEWPVGHSIRPGDPVAFMDRNADDWFVVTHPKTRCIAIPYLPESD